VSNYLESFKLRRPDAAENADAKHIELAALIEFSQTLNSSLNLLSELNNLLLVPMGRMMISKGAILLVTSGTNLRVELAKGLKNISTGMEIDLLEMPDELTFVDESSYEFFQTQHFGLLIPLRSRDKTIGLILLGKKLSGKPFTESELHFLSSLGNIAAPAIANSRMYVQLQQANHKLDQKVQVLNTLFEIGRELNRSFKRDEILHRLSLSLMGQMMINQYFVILKDSSEGALEVVYKKGNSFPQTTIESCLESSKALSNIASPMKIDARYPNLYAAGVLLVVPMILQQETRGYIFLGSKMNKQVISESDLDFLNLLANTVISAIENARLFEETLEKQRLEEELNVAKDIQQRLLPTIMPAIPGYDIHGLNIPSQRVGGDYFDIIPVSKEQIILTIADVSGKGMPASLLMSNLQAGLRMLAYDNLPLAKITSRLNNLIYQNTSIEKYITFFILRLNLKNHQLEFVNAGHNPPYLFHSDGHHDTLEEGGIILGMMPNMSFETGYLDFPPDGCLSLFTDGVTEAMDGDVPFDEFRVIDFFGKADISDSSKMINKKMIKRLYEYAGDPTKDDDITMLTVKRLKTENFSE